MAASSHGYNPRRPMAQARPAAEGPRAWAGFEPGGALSGELRIAGSKSLAQRALVLASLSGDATRIAGLPAAQDGARDVEHALGVARQCAYSLEQLAPAAVRIVGRPPGPGRGWNPSAPLDVGESGTLARLSLAALSLCGRAGSSFVLQPRASLRRRSSPALVDALVRSGVGLEAVDGGDPRATFALRVRPLGPPSEIVIDDPRSSQEVSALALALSAYPDTTELVVRGSIPSRPYLEMTLAVLRRAGVEVHSIGEPGGERLRLRGPLRPGDVPIVIEPDASSAAVALAAACLSEGELLVPGLGAHSLQGDVRIVELLRAFGCEARITDAGLRASGFPTQAAELDLSATPDLAPVLAAVGAAHALRSRASVGARAPTRGGAARTRLRGLETLPGKESQRIEVLARGLSQLGVEVESGADFLTIGAARAIASDEPVLLDPHGDHRMAFAFALLGLVRPGVRVSDPGCVAKSWASFWDDLRARGARLHASE